jgi:hypothetical protein
VLWPWSRSAIHKERYRRSQTASCELNCELNGNRDFRRDRTCTIGHCGTAPKTITLRIRSAICGPRRQACVEPAAYLFFVRILPIRPRIADSFRFIQEQLVEPGQWHNDVDRRTSNQERQ